MFWSWKPHLDHYVQPSYWRTEQGGSKAWCSPTWCTVLASSAGTWAVASTAETWHSLPLASLRLSFIDTTGPLVVVMFPSACTHSRTLPNCSFYLMLAVNQSQRTKTRGVSLSFPENKNLFSTQRKDLGQRSNNQSSGSLAKSYTPQVLTTLLNFSTWKSQASRTVEVLWSRGAREMMPPCHCAVISRTPAAWKLLSTTPKERRDDGLKEELGEPRGTAVIKFNSKRVFAWSLQTALLMRARAG